MKVTAIVLIAISAVCLFYAAVLGMQDSKTGLAVPLVMSMATFTVGALMLLYGGRGYFVSRNPAVRN